MGADADGVHRGRPALLRRRLRDHDADRLRRGASARVPLLYVGLPTLASLSVTHGYLPPHPAPTAIATMFHADIGKTLVYGIVDRDPGDHRGRPDPVARTEEGRRAAAGRVHRGAGLTLERDLPGVATSIVSALLPVLLIGLVTVARLPAPGGKRCPPDPRLCGQPRHRHAGVAAARHLHAGHPRGAGRWATSWRRWPTPSRALTMVMLIIAGAGALKQVLVDSGVSAYIGGTPQRVGRSRRCSWAG